MRLLIGIFVFLLSVYCGYQKSLAFKKRKEFYASFNNFNLSYKNAVYFDKKTLSEIVANDKKDDFNQLVRRYIINSQANFEQKYLTDDEKGFVLDYLSVIGIGDVTSQLDYIEHVYALIEEKRKQCVVDEKKFCSLYLKLSILIGLMMFILVI